MTLRQEQENRLKQIFGLDSFYDDQWKTISQILNGERILLIEKTGFGKSLCFQFPAIVFKGTTVVFSPLIALMRDQVKKLNSLGISAKSFANPNLLVGKNILLVDDIFDSGATVKELGKYLTSLGVIKVAPIVIARTVGGDIL